jgi:hypothetical protein
MFAPLHKGSIKAATILGMTALSRGKRNHLWLAAKLRGPMLKADALLSLQLPISAGSSKS